MRQLSAMQEQRLLAMRFPLPPWHHNMHNAACQFLNSACDMTRAGRAAGEPPEQVWAFLGRFGKLLKYASLSRRATTLECAVAWWNERKLQNMTATMRRMFIRAVMQRRRRRRQAVSCGSEAATNLDNDILRRTYDPVHCMSY